MVPLSNACSKRNLRLRIWIPLLQTHFNYIFFSFLYIILYTIIIIMHSIAHISLIKWHYSLIHSLKLVLSSSPFSPTRELSLTKGHHIPTHLYAQQCLIPSGGSPPKESFLFCFSHPRSSCFRLRRDLRPISPVQMSPTHNFLPQPRSYGQTGPRGFLHSSPGYIGARRSLIPGEMQSY